MEATMNDIFLDKVPINWNARAYPSMLPMGAWFADLLLRIKELESWITDFTLPNVVWLAGFFNPQSFLTGKQSRDVSRSLMQIIKLFLNNLMDIYSLAYLYSQQFS